MTPIPPDIATRWRPMWHPDAHPERPWWRCREVAGIVFDCIPPIYPAQWFRCDGVKGPGTSLCAGEPGDYCSNAIARIDAEHPIPEPLRLPTQVWAWIDRNGNVREAECGPTVVLVPGAILVSGPTPWGRDVPWSPT